MNPTQVEMLRRVRSILEEHFNGFILIPLFTLPNGDRTSKLMSDMRTYETLGTLNVHTKLLMNEIIDDE